MWQGKLSSGRAGTRQMRYLLVQMIPALCFLMKQLMQPLKAYTLLLLLALNLPAREQSVLARPQRRSARWETLSTMSSQKGSLWIRQKSTYTFICLLRVKKPTQSDQTCYSSCYSFQTIWLSTSQMSSFQLTLGCICCCCCWDCCCCCCCWDCWQQLGSQTGMVREGLREGLGWLLMPRVMVVASFLRWYLSWLLMLGYSLVILSLSMRIVIQLLRSPSLSFMCFSLSLARRAILRVSNSINTQTRLLGSSLLFTLRLRIKPNLLKTLCRYCQLVKLGSFLTEAYNTGMRCSLISYMGLLETTLYLFMLSAKNILKFELWDWWRVVFMVWQSAQAFVASSTLQNLTKMNDFMIYTYSIYPYLLKN